MENNNIKNEYLEKIFKGKPHIELLDEHYKELDELYNDNETLKKELKKELEENSHKITFFESLKSGIEKNDTSVPYINTYTEKVANELLSKIAKQQKKARELQEKHLGSNGGKKKSRRKLRKSGRKTKRKK